MTTDPSQLGRTPPHSLEAEQSLLAACLIDGGETIGRCLERGLTPAAFYQPAHRRLFEILVDLRRAGKPIAVDVLAEELRAGGELEAIGGMGFVLQVSEKVPTTAAASYFLKRVRELYLCRQIFTAATTAAERCFTDDVSPASLLDGLDALKTEAALSGAAHPLTIWAPAQFLAWQPPADACLLGDGLVEKGEFTSMVGIGGLGKSRLSLQMAINQILGRDWCALPTHGAPAKWLFISPENGIPRWKADLEKMLGGLTEAERKKVDERLRLFAMTPDEDGDVCLADPNVCARLSATLAAEKPDVVVFDPLADMVDGDESKTVDMVATLRRLRAIVRTAAPAAAVLVIHHSRTGAANVAQAGSNFDAGNFGRGAKVLFSRVRCELQLAPADKDDSNRLVLACGKASNGPKFETRGLIFDAETFTYSVDPDFSLDGWRDDVAGRRREIVVSIADAVEAVRELYQVGEDVLTADIVKPLREQTGACVKTIQRRLKEAAVAGYLRAGSKRGTWRLGSKPLKQ